MLASLNGSHLVLMAFWENFTVLDRLNGSVEMVLVNFTVNGSGSLFVTMLQDGLVHDSRCDSLVDGGIVLPSFGTGMGMSVRFERLQLAIDEGTDRTRCNGEQTYHPYLP